MSKKLQVMCYVTMIVVALSLTAILTILMPNCEVCGKRLCFGACKFTFDLENKEKEGGLVQEKYKTNQPYTMLAETTKQDMSYLDKVAFIGDSRTVAMQLFGVPLSSIYAMEGLTHEAAMYEECVRVSEQNVTTIADAVMMNAPEIMIINFGINGIAWLDEENFMKGYDEFVKSLTAASPSSIVVIEAIMPVTFTYANSDNGITNEKIERYNELLYYYAKKNGFYYLDTDSVLKDENNDLDDSYSGDGLHYNEKAYEVIIDYVLSHAIIKN